MEAMNFLIKALFLIGLIPIVLSLPPLYSGQYSRVRYQTHQNANKGKLELEETSREEVTEKSNKAAKPSPPNANLPSSGEIFELTTERESEQINFARFVHSKSKQTDKLRDVTPRFLDVDVNTSTIANDYTTTEANVESLTKQMDNSDYLENIRNDNESTTAEANIDFTTKQMDDTDNLRNVTNDNENADLIANSTTTAAEEINDKENLKSDDAELIENFDVNVESEVDDLNEQGVYYIIHPNGVFQKVVYKTVGPVSVSEDIMPIAEASYSYDPQTFVLQRLLFPVPSYI